MKIRFIGLVCHVTLDEGTAFEKQLAALPAAPDHKATLSVSRLLVSADPDQIGHTVGDSTCFPLAGCLSFPTLGDGRVAQQLIDELPSLKNVSTDGNLTPELFNCPPDPTVLSSVVYLPPNGRLMPEDFFDYEVDFNHVPHGPLPRTMIYLVATQGYEILDIGGHLVVLKEGADILVANVCQQDECENHFQNYKLLFDPPATTVFDPDDSAQRPCTFATPRAPLPLCAQGSDLGVDCSNSHFP